MTSPDRPTDEEDAYLESRGLRAVSPPLPELRAHVRRVILQACYPDDVFGVMVTERVWPTGHTRAFVTAAREE